MLLAGAGGVEAEHDVRVASPSAMGWDFVQLGPARGAVGPDRGWEVRRERITEVVAPLEVSHVQRYVPADARRWIITFVGEYDWPVDEAVAIVWCESGGDTDAHSWAGAIGLFQMMPMWASLVPEGSLWNGHDNTLAAYRLYVQSDRTWRHWVCQP